MRHEDFQVQVAVEYCSVYDDRWSKRRRAINEALESVQSPDSLDCLLAPEQDF
jgi:hypothetical protein